MSLALLALAAFVVGLAKGGLSSAASLAVPMLALFMNPLEAAALLLPVFLATDWIAVGLYRRDFSAPNVAVLVPAGLLGTALAVLVTPYTPESLLLLATGGIGLWYCARAWVAGVQPAGGKVAGWIWGVLLGLTSFITHSGAPPAQAYLMPQRLPKLEFARTMAIVFAVINLSKLPGYWAIGALSSLDLKLTFGLIVVGLAGTFLGRWIVERLEDRAYIRIIEALLLLLSLVLLWRGAMLLRG